MRRYVVKRLLLGLITLFGVSIIVFTASRLSGDVALMMAPQHATEAELQAVREHLGTDKPIPIQYYLFIKNSLHGDFGESFQYSRPVKDVVFGRLPATLKLGLISFVLGNFLGIFLGILSAIKPDSWMDWTGKSFALLGQAMPNFWVAVMLILIFSVKLGWLPTSGTGGIRHLILPVIAMSWFQISFTMRLTRSSMLDVLENDYIKLARIKGNPEWIIIWKHALRNALIPVVAAVGLGLAMTMGGSVFIETIFRWPGIGSLMVFAISNYDYPLIQAITLVIATFIVLINLLTDIVIVFVDPRIKID